MVLLVEKVHTDELSYHSQQAGQTHVQALADLCTTYFSAHLSLESLETCMIIQKHGDTTSLFLLPGSVSVPPQGVWEARSGLLSYLTCGRGLNCDLLEMP